MSLPVVLRPEAEADLVTAREWYEERSSGLGDIFIDAIDALLIENGNSPRRFAMVSGDVRFAKLSRFPYLLYFRPWDDRIEVSECCMEAAILRSGKHGISV
jgi:hypothetical protein